MPSPHPHPFDRGRFPGHAASGNLQPAPRRGGRAAHLPADAAQRKQAGPAAAGVCLLCVPVCVPPCTRACVHPCLFACVRLMQTSRTCCCRCRHCCLLLLRAPGAVAGPQPPPPLHSAPRPDPSLSLPCVHHSHTGGGGGAQARQEVDDLRQHPGQLPRRQARSRGQQGQQGERANLEHATARLFAAGWMPAAAPQRRRLP